jgi:hypothetical protein
MVSAGIGGPASAPAPAPPAPAAPGALPPDPILDAPTLDDPTLDDPVLKAPPLAREPLAAWPCTGCGAQVPIDDDVCGNCGRPFLPTDAAPSLALPGVGDLARMDKAQRVVVMVIGAVVIMAVLVGLAFVAGTVL